VGRIIFIDRDGVINKDPGGWTEHSYVTKWEQFLFLPNSIKALKKLCDAGYEIILISNQGGISKGHYTLGELGNINERMNQELEKEGARIKKAYYCIHQESDNCNCKKPKTGLFEQAEKELDITPKGAYFIGDGKMDVEAGKKLGLKTILVLSGKTDIKSVDDWQIKPDFIFNDLFESVNFILKGHKV